MTECESREARYVPWSFGEVYECATCRHRERLDHRLQPLRGSGYEAAYPFPEHVRRDLRCLPCACGYHDICTGRRVCDCECLLTATERPAREPSSGHQPHPDTT